MAEVAIAIVQFIFEFLLPALGCSIRWVVYLCMGTKPSFEQLFKDKKTNFSIGFIILVFLCTTITFLVN